MVFEQASRPSDAHEYQAIRDTNRRSGEAEQAFRCLERWCSTRFRPERYLRERLLREGYEENAVDAAIQRAANCLLIDDARYADALIRGRIRAGKGISGIEFELQSAGIDPASVPGWPHEYLDDSPSSQLQRAIMLLEAKPPRAKNVQAAAYRKLIQKGYGADVASRAAREYCHGSDA